MRDLRGETDGILGARRIPEIALEIGDLRVGNQRLVDVFRSEFDTGTQIGVHRTLAVGRGEDHRARGRRAADQRGSGIMHADGLHVGIEHRAKRIVRHLADIGCARTERGRTGGSIAGGTAGGLGALVHSVIERFRTLCIDQVHRAFDDAVIVEEQVVAAGDDVHDGIADGQHIKTAHVRSLSGQTWRTHIGRKAS